MGRVLTRRTALGSIVAGSLISVAIFVVVRASSSSSASARGESSAVRGEDPLLSDLGYGVVLPALADFAGASEELARAAEAFADAPSEARLAAVRGAWQEAHVRWRRLEPCLIGPDDPVLAAAKVAAFPIDEVALERRIGGEEGGAAVHVDALGARQRGIFVVEYLIYDEDGGSEGVLALHTSGPRAGRRRALLVALGRDVAAVARELHEAWHPEQGNFVESFARPGTEGSPYPDAQAAIDVVINRMVMHVEHMKDAQLKDPMGTLRERHPELAKAHRSDRSIEGLVAEIEGLRALYDGDRARAGLGGRVRKATPELDESLRFAFERSVHNLRAIPGPLDRAVLDSQAPVTKAYNVLGLLRDRLATHLVAVYDSSLTFGGFDGD